jgi:hypothetical protein
MDKPITKQVINLGVGGQLTRDEDSPDIPPRALVSFHAQAAFENVKHHFTDKGTVEEALIFTIDAATFEIDGIEEQPEQLELPEGEEAPKKRGRGGLKSAPEPDGEED